MPTASCFAIIPSEKSASSAKTKAGRFSLMLKALIALTVLTATLWQATGTTLAQDADPASDPAAAAHQRTSRREKNTGLGRAN